MTADIASISATSVDINSNPDSRAILRKSLFRL